MFVSLFSRPSTSSVLFARKRLRKLWYQSALHASIAFAEEAFLAEQKPVPLPYQGSSPRNLYKDSRFCPLQSFLPNDCEKPYESCRRVRSSIFSSRLRSGNMQWVQPPSPYPKASRTQNVRKECWPSGLVPHVFLLSTYMKKVTPSKSRSSYQAGLIFRCLPSVRGTNKEYLVQVITVKHLLEQKGTIQDIGKAFGTVSEVRKQLELLLEAPKKGKAKAEQDKRKKKLSGIKEDLKTNRKLAGAETLKLMSCSVAL